MPKRSSIHYLADLYKLKTKGTVHKSDPEPVSTRYYSFCYDSLSCLAFTFMYAITRNTAKSRGPRTVAERSKQPPHLKLDERLSLGNIRKTSPGTVQEPSLVKVEQNKMTSPAKAKIVIIRKTSTRSSKSGQESHLMNQQGATREGPTYSPVNTRSGDIQGNTSTLLCAASSENENQTTEMSTFSGSTAAKQKAKEIPCLGTDCAAGQAESKREPQHDFEDLSKPPSAWMAPHQLEQELRKCTNLHDLADLAEREIESTKPDGMSEAEFFMQKMKKGMIVASLMDSEPPVEETSQAETRTLAKELDGPPGSRPGGVWMKQKYRGILTCLVFGVLGVAGAWGCALDSRIVYQEPGSNGRLLNKKGHEVPSNGSQLIEMPQREPKSDKKSTAAERHRSNSTTRNSSVPPDDFELVIERKKRFLGCMAVIRIYHNGENKVGKLRNDGVNAVVRGKIGDEVYICGPLGDGLAFRVLRRGNLKLRIKVATHINPCNSDNRDYDAGAFGEFRYVPMKPKWEAVMSVSSWISGSQSPGNQIVTIAADSRSIKRNVSLRQNDTALPVNHR